MKHSWFKAFLVIALLVGWQLGYATDSTAPVVSEENFMDLHLTQVLFLFFVGFVGGLVSGFIGSGGAFVLTPAMMSMGVLGLVAVASNMCHKFPKALVGAMKRAKYGQVDVKLGIVMGLSAEAGVLVGAHVQEIIKASLGNDGSNLYVSVVFVLVLAIVGTYVLRDAWKMVHAPTTEKEEITKLAKWVQSVHIPGTMMYFKSIGTKISVLFTIPLGFATGMLAATIAVGGFIGVPAMMYILGVPSLMASASELVIAFIMGMGGTIKFAWSGYVDIRLAMIILAGSLFGIQLGAIGTTYVKPYMVKVVMGVIMILVLFSRGIMVPIYLANLGYIESFEKSTVTLASNSSFVILIAALLVGGVIVLYALWSGRRAHLDEEQQALAASSFSTAFTATTELHPLTCLDRILVATDNSEFSAGALRQAIFLAKNSNKSLFVMSVLISNPEYESLAPQLLEKEKQEALTHLEAVKQQTAQAGVSCEVLLRYGTSVYEELTNEAEKSRMDLIIVGRRGKTGLMRLMMGSTTAKVIGNASCCVLVAPRAAQVQGKHFLLAVDGSRHSDLAALAAANLAKHLSAPITVIAVVYQEHKENRQQEAEINVKRVRDFLRSEGVKAESQVVFGRYAEKIVEVAQTLGSDLIIVGSHGRTGFERMLIGSVSERVIGLSQGAVLVVKG